MKGNIYNRVHIPVPCHEDWNKMTPDDKGAFCKSCNKSVYDFSTRAEHEVESILLSLKGQEVCARFSNAQLGKQPELEIPLHAIPQNLSPFRKFFLAAFIVFGTTLFGCVNSNGQVLGKVKLTTKTIETPPPPQKITGDVKMKSEEPIEEVITMKGEIAYIPEDSTKRVKCTAPLKPLVNTLKADTVIMPEDIKPVIVEEELTSFISGNVSFSMPVVIEDVIDTPAVADTPEVVIEEPVIVDVEEPVTYSLGMMVMRVPSEEVQVIIPEEPAEVIPVEVITNTWGNDSADDANKSALLTGDGLKPSLQCWPNPSNGAITISYEIKKRGPVQLELFDSKGERVKTLLDMRDCYNAVYNTAFDLSELDAGAYTCVLRAGSDVSTTRVVIVR